MSGNNDLSKYIISTLLFLVGVVTLYSYIIGQSGDGLESQPVDMLFAGLALIIVAVIALPQVLNKLDEQKYKGLMIFGIVGALALGYSVVNSVSTEIEFQKTMEDSKAVTIQH